MGKTERIRMVQEIKEDVSITMNIEAKKKREEKQSN